MKVFITSFHRCATTSLSHLVKTSLPHPEGNPVCDHGNYPINKMPESIEALKNKEYSGLLSMSVKYNIFADSPWFLYYYIFDYMIPDAKFIHCPREPEAWFESCERYLGSWVQQYGVSPTEKLIYGEKYGDPRGNKTRWIEVYTQHQENINNFFKGKDNFLEVDIFGGEKNIEQKVCQFLGEEYKGVKLIKVN